MKKHFGFTLIELILYITITASFMTGSVIFAWDVVYGREKFNQQQIVEETAKIALGRIAYEIRRANTVQSVTASQLILDNGNSTTTIASQSGSVVITSNGVGPYTLTSNQVTVTDMRFLNVSSTNNNSKNIQITLSLTQTSSILSKQVVAQTTMMQSVELNGQFNHGRALLMNAGDVFLTTGNKHIENTFIENTGTGNITIDKMILSWTGGSLGSMLQTIRIDGTNVWSGSVSSGALLDVTNVTLIAGAVEIPIDYFDFSSNMANSIITITFIMTDASTNSTEITLGAIPTPTLTGTPTATPTNSPTPTNTPTPTPTPANCTAFCQLTHGLPGSCKKTNQCSGFKYGAIYECSPPNICCCQ